MLVVEIQKSPPLPTRISACSGLRSRGSTISHPEKPHNGAHLRGNLFKSAEWLQYFRDVDTSVFLLALLHDRDKRA